MMVGLVVAGGSMPKASADGFQRISGEGSSWAANAIDAMRVNVRQFGITVDYNPSGSTAGRKNFLNGTVDFAASDIPFQFKPEDGSAPEKPAPGSYAYMPVTAGGTAFMYNLLINGKRVTNLRLSGENATKIFTGAITSWNDPAIQADNPGLTMPARTIVPVVRSDGSGSSAQFTKWMIAKYPALWTDYCNRSGRAPACGETSFYPTIAGMIAQSGDLGIAGYVSQGFAEGAIGYVNYSYALGSQFPVAKVLNAAGYYTEPTPQNVAVSLLKAQINTNESDPTVYLTQQLEGVYADTDPRSYQLSSYSYLILPTTVAGQFNLDKGKTLGAFAYYAMCQAQQQSASLGYSPMPLNLVQASFDQIRKIPGVVVQDIDISACKNPAFAADGTNLLADTAPQPLACDQQGLATQCPNGTGGLSNIPTAVSGGTVAGGGTTATTLPGAGSGAGTGTGTGAGSGAGTGTATGTDAGTGSGTPTTVAGVAVADTGAAGQGCDADTGLCGAGDAASAGGVASADGSGAIGAVLTTTLAQSSGWGASIGLLLLIVVLVLALILTPALAWRYFSNRQLA
ncbi:MAG: phosphate ABC transporter substrate-binding protein [Actinobacteria bacterium]|nr:phosphate ABC transporter substrate-binding protein [Actinomycetota bacterium]